ncbi:MAG: hypothetical protein IID55_00830 [Proteobacteria bacterium]|nr:hypothetical protein [Pseudomonadota bacterium]
MIAPQISFASVTPMVSAVPLPAPQKEVAPAANAARSNPDSYLGANVQPNEKPDVPAEEVKAERAKAEEAKQARVERQLADLGGTRLSILHDDDADRFVYRSVNAESKEVERQYPTDDDLERITQFREQAARAFDEDV